MVHHSCLSHDALVSALYQHATSNSKETPDKKGEGKKLLKLWLAYAAKCKDKIWRISNESLLQAHSLPDIVPQELIDSVRSPHKSKGLSQDGEDAVTAVKKAKPPKVLLSLEEEEKRLKPGSAKHAAFHLLKDPAYSLTGITGEEVIRLSEEKGIKKDWSEKALDTVKSVLSSEVCFCKVSEKPSRYALTNMPGVVPMAKKEAAANDSAPKPKNKVDSQADDGPASSSKTKKVVSALLQPSSNPADASNSDALSKAESKLQQMKGLCQKHEASVKKAELFIEELETNLKEAVERESSKSASQADKNNQDDDEEDEWAGAPSIELPDDLKEYRGDPTDRKAQVAFNKKRQEAERELRSKRESWIMEQRKLRLKGKGSSVAEIRAKIKQATVALDTAKKGRDSSLAALKDAELAVDRERQRKMLKEVKEQGKTSKEEEKERLRLEREKEIERRKNDPLTK